MVVNCGRKSGKRGRKKETDEDEHGLTRTRTKQVPASVFLEFLLSLLMKVRPWKT